MVTARYCFSFFQRAIGENKDDYLHHKVRSVDVEKVKKLFTGQIPKSQFSWYIREKKVLQIGGLSDCLDFYERKFGKFLELLKFFNSIDYPVSISTKGVWWTKDERYREAFRDAKNVHMKSSIISLDEDKVHQVERGVATAEERFLMLEECNKLGVAATTVRFRPFILGMSADFPWSEKARQQIDAFCHRTKEAGCYSLTTEFLCWESRASKTAEERAAVVSKITGIPQYPFYRQYSQSKSGLMRLNYDLKRPYIEAMQEACDKYGVKFFVSDAHHKEKSYHAGCCGLPENGPLSNTNRGQYAEAILIAKRTGRVAWADIAEAAAGLKEIPFYAAEGFNQGGTDERVKRMYQSMWDYMRDVWNNPKSGMSPARYFGGALVPDQPDENGDIVYLYNEPFVVRAERVGSVQELALHLVKQGYAMQEDGGDWGHVAYDVVVNAIDVAPGKKDMLSALEQNRINAKVYVNGSSSDAWKESYPNTDFLELPAAMQLVPRAEEMALDVIREEMTLQGIERVWVLRLTDIAAPFDGKTPRAVLSALEAGFTADPVGFQRVQGYMQLLECAPLTMEQKGLM